MYNQKVKLKLNRYVKLIPESAYGINVYGVITAIPKHKRFYIVGILNKKGKVVYKQSAFYENLKPVHKHQVIKGLSYEH